MIEQHSTPGQTRGAEISLAATCNNTPSGYDAANDTRPRCLRCGHPLTLPRSVSRAYGPRCWTRTALGQLDRRRDHIGRGLGSLARRVARLDLAELATASAALSYAEGVTQ